jgi:hypothetical protein
MKIARINFSENLIVSENPTVIIDCYKWVENNYKPLTEVFLCHNDKAIKVKIKAHETELRYEAKTDDGRVWCDSCVEFFVKPFASDDRYINFEINPIGSMIMSIGEVRMNRKTIVFKYKPSLDLKTEAGEECWYVEFIIPFAMLYEIYNITDKIKLNSIFVNFYKCGDETKFPHFGMWNEVLTEDPDFHRPEYFGELILE